MYIQFITFIFNQIITAVLWIPPVIFLKILCVVIFIYIFKDSTLEDPGKKLVRFLRELQNKAIKYSYYNSGF